MKLTKEQINERHVLEEQKPTWEEQFDKEFKGSVALIDEMGGTIPIEELKEFMSKLCLNNV